LHRPRAVVVEEHDGRQGDGGHQPVLPGAVDQRRSEALGLHHQVVGVGGAAGHVVDGGGVEGQADGEDHGAGDDGREKTADLLYKNTHRHRHGAAHQHGAGDGGDAAALSGDGLHAGQIGEADAQNHRQARAEPPADGVELKERGYRGHHQRRLNQQDAVWPGAVPAALEMMMAGVTQPTIMATRCCSARETEVPGGGSPFH
jgi:hypothetical protein